MGFDLSGHGGYFSWTASGWYALLDLAQDHGWTAIGTGAPRGTLKRDWPGIYDSNEGQLFYARDAREFAAALERFLATKRVKARHSDFDSPSARSSLREFIEFCREGSFRIY